MRLAIAALLVVCGGRDAASEDAPTLAERAAAIERVSQATDGGRVVVGYLSRTLGIPVETLRAQRTQTGLTWGELFIATWLVQHARDEPTLERIVADFQGGQGWEAIATAHGADMAALTAAVEHSQTVVEQNTEDHAPATDNHAGDQRPSRGGRGGGGGRRNH